VKKTKIFQKQRIPKYFLSIWVWVLSLGIKLFEYLGLGLSIEYILNNQTQMLEYFEYTYLVFINVYLKLNSVLKTNCTSLKSTNRIESKKINKKVK